MMDEVYDSVLTSTGFVQRKDGPIKDRVPDFDPRSGDHYWALSVLYKCDPQIALRGDAILDLETLVSVAGPGCVHCGEVYSTRIEKRRCRGNIE